MSEMLITSTSQQSESKHSNTETHLDTACQDLSYGPSSFWSMGFEIQKGPWWSGRVTFSKNSQKLLLKGSARFWFEWIFDSHWWKFSFLKWYAFGTCLEFLASSPQKSRCLDVVPLDLGIGIGIFTYWGLEMDLLIRFRSLPGGCCRDLICRSFVGFLGYSINFNCVKRLLQDPCLQSVWYKKV